MPPQDTDPTPSFGGFGLFKDVVGKNYLTSNTTVWYRLAEIRLWFLVGYPVGMMVDADCGLSCVPGDEGSHETRNERGPT